MLRDKPMTSAEANALIRKRVKYKLPNKVIVPKNITLPKFVERFLTDWAINHPTLYVSNNTVQTHDGAYRSLGDITRLCHYYINEDVTLEEVKNVLKDLVNNEVISTDICLGIHKRVFYSRSGGQIIDEQEDRDEFGWKFNLGKISKIPKRTIKYK